MGAKNLERGYTHNQDVATPAPVPSGGGTVPPAGAPLSSAGAPLPPTPGPQDVAGKLTEEEMVELDQLITPRMAFLLTKAYPPAYEVFRVFFGDNFMETQGRPQVAQAAPGGLPGPTSGLGGSTGLSGAGPFPVRG